MSARVIALVCLICTVLFSARLAGALPWDIDMYRQESLKSNEVGRAPVIGTIPRGYKPFRMSIEEAEKSLQNPVPGTLHSAWRGQRLWNANCLSCHGELGVGDGPVGPLMGVPNLLTDFYKNKSDGRVFAVIHHGLRAMPRYGYKLSVAERWDLVNYLRVLQGERIAGFKRPKG